ncbi:MAG: hypothetical protein ACI92W_001155 [Paraglaciecola sp.]|jgi:hypothetical protein
MKNYVLFIFLILIFVPFHQTLAQTSFKVGSGIYQFSNFDPELVQGLSFNVGHQFNSERIPRLGIRPAIIIDHFASETGERRVTQTKGLGVAAACDISWAILQKEKFEWRVNTGGFLSHYQVIFAEFVEVIDVQGARIRSDSDVLEDVNSAFGYQLSSSLLFQLKGGKWMIINPFEWQIAPDGYARLTASLGFTL